MEYKDQEIGCALRVQYPVDGEDSEIKSIVSGGALTGDRDVSFRSIRLGSGVGSNVVGACSAPYMPVKGDTFQIHWLGHQDRSYLDSFFYCEASDADTVIARMHDATRYRKRAYVFRRGDVGFIKPSEEVLEAYNRLVRELKDE